MDTRYIKYVAVAAVIGIIGAFVGEKATNLDIPTALVIIALSVSASIFVNVFIHLDSAEKK